MRQVLLLLTLDRGSTTCHTLSSISRTPVSDPSELYLLGCQRDVIRSSRGSPECESLHWRYNLSYRLVASESPGRKFLIHLGRRFLIEVKAIMDYDTGIITIRSDTQSDFFIHQPKEVEAVGRGKVGVFIKDHWETSRRPTTCQEEDPKEDLEEDLEKDPAEPTTLKQTDPIPESQNPTAGS